MKQITFRRERGALPLAPGALLKRDVLRRNICDTQSMDIDPAKRFTRLRDVSPPTPSTEERG
jgi:hypothetical protein